MSPARAFRWGPLVVAALALSACSPSTGDELASGDTSSAARYELDESALSAGSVRLEGTPFRQVSLLVIGEIDGDMTIRVSSQGESPVDISAEVTWREGNLAVARALLDRSYDRLELVRTQSWHEATVELHSQIVARRDWPLARDLPVVAPPAERIGEHFLSVQQALPGFVVTRAAWGARDPNRICGDAHTPRRITVHHTVTPTVDSVSAEQRVRGIQTFHIDTRGWCDVGYHFLVAQDGRVFQGRSSELRTGAHVGGANTDNVGVSFLGTFTDDVPSDAQFSGGARIIAWLASEYSIALNRTQVKGHREFGSTSCPGDQLYARLQRLIDEAAGGDPGPGPDPDPTPDETYDVDVDVRLIGLSDRLEDGRSAGVADAVPGEVFQAEIRLSNRSSTAIRDVQLAYRFDTPNILATNYVIESDHPAYDQATWVANSADGDEANPARGGLGGSGWLVMHAFSPNETKRVLVDFRASGPSVFDDAPLRVRGWLRSAADIYGVHDNWDRVPPINLVGDVVRDESNLDVLTVDGWTFDGTDLGTEGWTSCRAGALDRFEVNETEGTLSAQAVGPGPCVQSPAWTAIDADAFDQLVVRMRSYAGGHIVAASWSDGVAEPGPAQRIEFRTDGDGEFRDLVIPVGESESWTGTVGTLKLELAVSPAAAVTGWHDIDGVWLQNSTTRATTIGSTFSDAAPVGSGGDPVDPGNPGGDPGGDPGDPGGDPDPGDPGNPADPGADPGGDPGADPVDGGGGRPPLGQSGESAMRVRGCASTPGLPGGWLAWFALIALVRRRRPDAARHRVDRPARAG